MTRSSIKELLSPFENLEQKFRSKRRLFDTSSLVESNSPEFDHNFDIQEQSEEGGKFLKELRDSTFSGSEHEDANEHIKKVLEIVDLFHMPKVTQDQIMLRAFPVSLTRAASRWLRNQPSGSITTWEVLKTKFMNKYCPPARTAKKMEEINNFQQEPDESLFRAWERFKELLMKCPQHYLTDIQKVILFYNGLDVPTRQILNSKDAQEANDIYEVINREYSPIPIPACRNIDNPDQLCRTKEFTVIRHSIGNDEEFITIGPSKVSTIERTHGSMSCIYHKLFNRKDHGWTIILTIITSLKALDEGYSRKNYVRKFLRALNPKWRAKVMTIKESKDLTSLSLDELFENLKVHEMIIKKDYEIVKAKEEIKSLALKAKKESSDEECSTSRSEDEEYAMAVRDNKKLFKCGDPNHLIGECPKPPKNKNQRAFIRGSWSDSGEEDDAKVKDETCLVAQASSETCLGVDLEPDEWIKDNGFSKHMTGNRKLFPSYKAFNRGNVIFGSSLHGNIIGKGQICDNKCRVTFSKHDSEITKDGKVI
ncbi:retrovirus-related pol polyprotein from transposon TNT 1-94, partial [Tanacetum coccineum]